MNVNSANVQDAPNVGISCYTRMGPGRIGSVDLQHGCYTFWEVIALMARDIAKSGKGAEVRSAIADGKTARQLMRELYGVEPPAPSASHYATPETETRILRKWIRLAETDIRRAGAQKERRAAVEPARRALATRLNKPVLY